jgi:hypothetical protein
MVLILNDSEIIIKTKLNNCNVQHWTRDHLLFFCKPPRALFEWLELGNCDIDYFSFCHRQIQNFQILKQSEWYQNFCKSLPKSQRQKWLFKKYNKIGWSHSFILTNFDNFCRGLSKTLKYHLVMEKYWKLPLNSSKQFAKIVINMSWFVGKGDFWAKMKSWLNFVNFCFWKMDKIWANFW